MSRSRRATLLMAALVLSAASAVVAFLYTPYKGFAGETFVDFAHGTGAPSMAGSLAHAGVIRWPWEFLAMRALHPSATLQAGEYRFTGPASVQGVFNRIARGDVFFVEVTVPEGSNMFDIAALVDQTGIISGENFLQAASAPAPIRDITPQARSQEGYLFPATYRLNHSTTAPQLCQMMTAQFRREWKRLAGSTRDVHGIVTLASLVEKETSVAEERPVIAGVFVNRLNHAMRLDCDPTTIYAALLDQRYSGTIHRSDLNSKNPYNTYQNDGLPPGPIANPGRASIEAALHPSQTDYLYFVAKPAGGGHQFSSTLAAHEKAVREYRHVNSSKAAKTSGKAG